VLGGRTASTIAYTPDGKTLAAGLSDGTIALWDVAGGRVSMVLQGYTQRVSSLAISPDGKHLAAGGLDGVITLWDPTTGAKENGFAYGHGGEVTSLAFSPRGTTLASGGKDTTVRLWNVAALQEFAVLHGHRSPVSCVAFSPDGHTLASSGHDGTLRFWDIANRREKAVVNGHTVKVGKSREETQVIDGETISRRVAVPGETEDLGVAINCLAYSPDGKTLATGDHAMWQTGGVSLRDAATGQERVNFKPLHFVGSEPQLPDINALAYSPDGKLLASAGSSSIRLSDAATGKELAVLKTGIPGAIPDVAFSPDGQTLASCSDHVVQFWNVAAALQLAAKSSR
jgi:WD40 repeat protein